MVNRVSGSSAQAHNPHLHRVSEANGGCLLCCVAPFVLAPQGVNDATHTTITTTSVWGGWAVSRPSTKIISIPQGEERSPPPLLSRPKTRLASGCTPPSCCERLVGAGEDQAIFSSDKPACGADTMSGHWSRKKSYSYTTWSSIRDAFNRTAPAPSPPLFHRGTVGEKSAAERGKGPSSTRISWTGLPAFPPAMNGRKGRKHCPSTSANVITHLQLELKNNIQGAGGKKESERGRRREINGVGHLHPSVTAAAAQQRSGRSGRRGTGRFVLSVVPVNDNHDRLLHWLLLK